MNLNVTVNPTVVQVSTVAGAIVGVVQWALQAYVFHGKVPDAVNTALLILIPAICTGVASLVSRERTKTAVTASSPPAVKP